MRYISILGSTGSIGIQSLDVIENSQEQIKVLGLTTNKNINLLYNQVMKFNPEIVCVFDKKSAFLFEEKLKNISIENIPKITTGIEGLIEVSTYKNQQTLITAVVGMIGLLPTLEAIKNGITIALANKETLVTAGDIVMRSANEYGSKIIPVDSEHSAIYQCLQGEDEKKIRRLIITASGGAFRDFSKKEIKNKKAKEALKHPNWSMGDKITIDSATMMNKGLEVIEAHFLFNQPLEKIDVTIHKQSIVHSMIEFEDFTVKAQLASPDMKGPISYAINFPIRKDVLIKPLSFTDMDLSFKKIDENKYPCFTLAKNALKSGGTSLTVLNAANEIAVKAYLKDKIGFYDINKIIANAIKVHNFVEKPALSEIIEVDKKTRDYVEKMIENVTF